MRRSKHSQEFKGSTVQLIINNNESVVKVAEDLDLNPKTLYLWVTTYKRAHNIPIKSLKASSNETLDEENKRLHRENKILKQERDILKKATAYFAKETL